MDRRKYFAITHRNHEICNPTSLAKIDEFVAVLPLESGSRVIDFACGKAEILLRIAESFDANGVGVDIAPAEVEAALARVQHRDMTDRIEIVESDGAAFETTPDSFDLAMCIGATWIWQGYTGTIDALKRIVVPGGLIAIGEPFKRIEPHPDFIAADPEFVPTLVTHAENAAIAEAHGLEVLYTIVSSPEDWDRYEGLQTLAVDEYARQNADDADVDELRRLRREYDNVHRLWARDTLGWAIYLLRAP